MICFGGCASIVRGILEGWCRSKELMGSGGDMPAG